VSIGGVTIADSSKIELAESPSVNGVPTSTRLLKTGTLTIGTSNSQLDLKNNKAVVSQTVGTFNGTAYTGVTGQVKSGQGTITGGQPAWNGSGIVTSMTDATASTLTTLAVASVQQVTGITSGTTLFAGQTVSFSDSVVKYTWAGDANLSGNVDADDYFQIDSNYNKSGTVFGYNAGDFNYNGVINGDDFGLIDQGFSGQTGVIANGSIAGGGGVTAVPEPAGATIIALGAASLLRRRRRA